MSEQCALETDHEFESRSGALKLFQDGTFTEEWVCPDCVEKIRKDRITDHRIFVMEGREVVLPTEEIDV